MLSFSVDPLPPLLKYVLIVSITAVTADGGDKQGWDKSIRTAHTVYDLLGN